MLDAWISWVTSASFLWAWMGIAVTVAAVLSQMTAPYGRHARTGWGPAFSAQWSWMVMEAVSLAVFLACFWASEHRSAAAWTFVGLYTAHYGYRSFVYPFLGSSSGSPMPLSGNHASSTARATRLEDVIRIFDVCAVRVTALRKPVHAKRPQPVACFLSPVRKACFVNTCTQSDHVQSHAS